MSAWPASLPLPLLSGYGGSPEPAFVRTDMEAGTARQRQRSSAAPHNRGVEWVFTAAQMVTFLTFFEDTVHFGTDWFTMSLDVGNGLASYDCRFSAPYKDAQLGNSRWSVSAQIDVRGV